ncbi:MAG TPA: hypothetical protein VMW47_07870 [Verrucomicrobiae bacterium]|nr:hypothetical protein [Verrucomicrobiae bacterium]
MVADLGDVVEQVGGERQRPLPLCGHGHRHLPDLAARRGVAARRGIAARDRVVPDQEVWPLAQGWDERHLRSLADRELADATVAEAGEPGPVGASPASGFSDVRPPRGLGDDEPAAEGGLLPGQGVLVTRHPGGCRPGR